MATTRMLQFKSLTTKLVAGFLAAAAVTLAVGLYGVSRQAAIHRSVDEIASNDLLGLVHLNQASTQALLVRNAVLQHVLATDKAEMAQLDGRIDALDAAFDKELAAYEATVENPEEGAALDRVRQTWADYQAVRNRVRVISRAGDKGRALAASREGGAALVQATQALDDSVALRVRGTEADAQASDRLFGSSRRNTTLLVVVAVALAIGLGLLLARAIARPLKQAEQVLRAMAEGDLSRRLEVSSRDEVGRMAAALNQTVDRVRAAIQTIAGSARSLATAAEQLRAVSQQVGAGAEETSAQAGTVSAAAEEVSANIETVAAGAEQMGASIAEIARNASAAADVAASAVQVADSTNQTIVKLGASSSQIGEFVKVITSIAEQTNLLALNATIEAARAGEAGKGFAVVAGEVKELAKETAKATEDISRRIETIQVDSHEAVGAIGRISQIIDQISGIQTTIASAVEEQTVTTNEIGRSVGEVAAGSSEIAQNDSGVADAASDTTAGAAETQRAAQELARLSADLQELVGQFRV